MHSSQIIQLSPIFVTDKKIGNNQEPLFAQPPSDEYTPATIRKMVLYADKLEALGRDALRSSIEIGSPTASLAR